MIPISFKFTKFHKNPVSNIFLLSDSLSFGNYGILALQPGRISVACITAIQTVLKKLNGKYWIRIFPHFPVTAKPIEIRMGKGKGAIEY